MLHLHLSNRPDSLAMALAALMRTDPLPLLESEYIVVPATGVSRCLGFQLSDMLGISTQIAFPFPAAFAWQLFGRVLPDVAAANPFDRAPMQWRLLRLLGTSRAPEVKRFLVDDDGVKAHELAGRLAALFERYLVERPDWIAAWNAGRLAGLGHDEVWQAGLWRALLDELPDVARAHPRDVFLAQLKNNPQLRSRLPRRISLFAVESMPALYWEVFVGLAEWIDLHVFVLAPSREYWGDIDRLRTHLRMEIENPTAAALLDVGHPLLASLGRARQHAVVRLADVASRMPSAEHAYFVDPPATLLGRLQRDMLDLDAGTAVPVDASLQIHACHGPLREAEVLHDRLLSLFEAMPDLRPADILILTPDIEAYAPIVESVLMYAASGRRIPCAVADRPLGQLALWRALRRLLLVAAGDLDAESVMALLEEAALRRAFALEEHALPRLRDWVAEAGIRWGLDGGSRRRRGLPADDANTWRAGLRRMLLGVAMPDVPERLVGEILPLAGIEGADATLLGRFIDYCEALFALAEKVGAGPSQADAPLVGGCEQGLRAWGANKVGADGTAPRQSVAEWVVLIGAALERFLAPSETEEDEAQRLRAAFAALAAAARDAGCETRLPLRVMLREIDGQLAERASAKAFASGMATIAALQPARPLAARVICLVGMNDGAWPRPTPPLSLDLIARFPRLGDFNRRGEERHAFLETVLCAADALLVTYGGRDARSNVEYPPAAPLAELIDVLSAMTGEAPARLVMHHPLQPFSATYFDGADPRRYSYDAEHCPPGGGRAAPPFLAAGSLVEPQDSGCVELERLQRFFAHPVRFHLREQLGIHLEESEELLEIHEPFVADKLDSFHLRAEFFAACKDGEPAEETLRRLRARGWLPHGAAGELACTAARAEALPLWQAARPWARAEALPPCEASFADGVTTLTGRLDALTAAGLWRVRHGKTRAEDLLRSWLDHLLLQIAAPDGVTLCSVLVALDGETKFAPQARAAEILADLLDCYRQGLRMPLPFYPRTAWAWLDGKAGWRTAWAGLPYRQRPGEQDDPYVQLALRDRTDDPLGPAFQEMAARIYGPLRAAMVSLGEKLGDG